MLWSPNAPFRRAPNPCETGVMWGTGQLKTSTLWRIFALSTMLVVSIPNAAEKGKAESNKESELKAVRSRIESIRKGIEADAQRRDALANSLKEADLAVQSAREKVARLRADRLASEKRLAELERDRFETQKQVAAERGLLAKQLRTAYVIGREEQLILLLNQQNPGDLGRMMAYYGYFGRARAERIATIADRLAHLDLLSERVTAETEELRVLEESQARETKQLGQARSGRAQTLATIQSKIRSRNDQAARLERQAKVLEKLIDELQRAAKEFPTLPTQGFARTQGKLPWPVNGKVIAGFGQSRGGGSLRWEGILIGAEPGTQVRALFHGRVVYADHLYGMGLMVMIDHGDGFSSIYGHQEQLFRKVGDSVAPGDVLGVLADQTRAQGEPRGELHLEIRKGKQALDPRKWLRKQ
jgi:murein hydrolase activator